MQIIWFSYPDVFGTDPLWPKGCTAPGLRGPTLSMRMKSCSVEGCTRSSQSLEYSGVWGGAHRGGMLSHER
jgi:hypothetical protein